MGHGHQRSRGFRSHAQSRWSWLWLRLVLVGQPLRRPRMSSGTTWMAYMGMAQRVGALQGITQFALGFMIGVMLVQFQLLWLVRESHVPCSRHEMRAHVQQKVLAGVPPVPDPLPKPAAAAPSFNLTHKERKFLLVGVMTNRKYLATRVHAMHKVWGKDVPGDVMYFVGQGAPYTGDLPVRVLDDVTDNVYPPQRKSFAMLEYMYRHHGDDYEWFMRADDDVFVKTERLERFLRSINSDRPQYLGQQGTGVVSERGKLGLLHNSPYCMGGPGILFTKATLSALDGNIKECLEDTVTSHEDSELGRCVYKYAGIHCAVAYELMELFYQNYREKNGSFTHALGESEQRALTLHPIKDPPFMYRLAIHHKLSVLQQLHSKKTRLQREVLELDSIVNKSAAAATPRFPAKTVADAGDTTTWDFVSHMSRHSLHTLYRVPDEPVRNRGHFEAFSAAASTARQDSQVESLRHPSYLGTLYGHQQLHPTRGVRHRLVYQGQNGRLLNVGTVQKFTHAQIREENVTSALKTRIYMLLPLYARSAIFQRFMTSLNETLVGFHGAVHLRVILYSDPANESYVSMALVEKFRKWFLSAPSVEVLECDLNKANDTITHRKSIVPKLAIDVIKMAGDFARGVALDRGLAATPPAALTLILDVDMVLRTDFLVRTQLNTVAGRQAYYPVYFTQYDPRGTCLPVANATTCPSRDLFDFSDFAGMWRHFSFGILSIYRSDVSGVGGFDTSVRGWGKEDVDFFRKVLLSRLAVLRSSDPGLVHVHHPRNCDVKLPADQYRMCLSSRDALFGSTVVLAKMAESIVDKNV